MPFLAYRKSRSLQLIKYPCPLALVMEILLMPLTLLFADISETTVFYMLKNLLMPTSGKFFLQDISWASIREILAPAMFFLTTMRKRILRALLLQAWANQVNYPPFCWRK